MCVCVCVKGVCVGVNGWGAGSVVGVTHGEIISVVIGRDGKVEEQLGSVVESVARRQRRPAPRDKHGVDDIEPGADLVSDPGKVQRRSG